MKKAAGAAIAGLVLGSLSMGAWPHGPESHRSKKATSAPAEQKPFGIAGDAKNAARTIRVDMNDAMRFVPADLQVREGETVRFVVKNSGKVMHEMVLGTDDELKKHAELMRKFPDMEHDEPHMVHVAPGKTGELAWTFNRSGEFRYACLIPGHFEAGMTGKIVVVPAGASRTSSATAAPAPAPKP